MRQVFPRTGGAHASSYTPWLHPCTVTDYFVASREFKAAYFCSSDRLEAK